MAGTASTTLNVITPPPPITRAANGVTIQYTGSEQAVIDAYNSSTPKPLFILANPRGTLQSGVPQPEYFAVVNDSSKAQITAYAKNQPTGISYFTTSGQLVPFNNIVTTHMTNMNTLFFFATTFNGDISSWDTAKVSSMDGMFSNVEEFDQDISKWNVSEVRIMNSMFYRAFKFNKYIGSWNTAKVTDMSYMFTNARAFNQPIGEWNTSNVETMTNMFNDATAFNNGGTPNIYFLNTSKVTNMDYMFQNAQAFNQNISAWNVTLVTPKPPTDFRTGSPLITTKIPLSFR
jgi:surface protein